MWIFAFLAVIFSLRFILLFIKHRMLHCKTYNQSIGSLLPILCNIILLSNLWILQAGWCHWNFGLCCWHERREAWNSKSWCGWWEEEVIGVVERSRQSPEQENKITSYTSWQRPWDNKRWWYWGIVMLMMYICLFVKYLAQED